MALDNSIKNRNYTFDVLKIILAFCIVLKHTESVFKEALDPLTTCAVPMFFMTSGWLVFCRPITKQRLIKNGLKMMRIFIYATAFWWIVRCYTKGLYIPDAKDMVLLIFSNNERVIGHLWYLSAYAYTLFAVAILTAFDLTRRNLPKIATLLFVIYFVCDAYVVYTATYKSLTLVYLFRNWVFTGIPFFLIGGFFSMHRVVCRNGITVPVIIVLSIIALVEIHIFEPIHIADVFWTTIPLSTAAFVFAISQNVQSPSILSKWGEKYSLYIYIFHPLYCDVLLRDWIRTSYEWVQVVSPLVVFSLSLASAMFFVWIKNIIAQRYNTLTA